MTTCVFNASCLICLFVYFFFNLKKKNGFKETIEVFKFLVVPKLSINWENSMVIIDLGEFDFHN